MAQLANARRSRTVPSQKDFVLGSNPVERCGTFTPRVGTEGKEVKPSQKVLTGGPALY